MKQTKPKIVRLWKSKGKQINKKINTHTYLTPCDTEFALPGGVSLQKKKNEKEQKTTGEVDYFLFWFHYFLI